MNDAHFHLIVNHFPILMPIIGILVLLGGVIFKSEAVKRAAYFIFVVGAVATMPAFSSGEGAEEVVEHMAGASHDLIHEHEEKAELFAIISYVLGALSLLGFFASWKKMKFASILSYVIILVAAVAIYLGKETGTSGGEISHPEIRKDYKASSGEGEEADEGESEEENED